MAITIQPASMTDIPALVDLLGILFAIEQDFTPDPPAQQRGLELLLKHPERGQILLACDESAGVIGMVSIGDTNFRGTGDAVSLTYETSGDDTDAHGYSLSYRHPWIDSKETVGTLRIYNRTYEYDDYDTNDSVGDCDSAFTSFFRIASSCDVDHAAVDEVENCDYSDQGQSDVNNIADQCTKVSLENSNSADVSNLIALCKGSSCRG